MKNGMKRIAAIILAISISIGLANIPAIASAFDVQYNRRYVQYCEEIGMKYHVSPEVLEAIIEHESRGDDSVGNSYGCYGLMGVSAYWNRDRMQRLGVTDLHDPYGNILVATDLLFELYEKYEDNYEVLRFYGGYPEGDYKFSKYILDRAWQLEVIHGKHSYLAKG